MSKKRKILNVSETPTHFNLDVRVSIHKNNISQELIDDLLASKEDLINGNGNQIHYVRIKQAENGEDLLAFETEYFYGVE
jgi:hypothetical protein